MKRLVILSGKGGTGKTTVATSFIILASARAYADCDVEAPNLHLSLPNNGQPKRTAFLGMPKAIIRPEACIGCGVCRKNCRFDAIYTCGTICKVDQMACEGCGLCAALCPTNAIDMKSFVAGELMLYSNNDRAFSTATLHIGAGTSGKLVTAVKKQLDIETPDVDFSVIDGPPGIGCPVMASLAGADFVLLVAEPTRSGFSDLERVFRTVKIVGCTVFICVNLFDLNPEGSVRIKRFCKEQGAEYVGEIPYDPAAVRAANEGVSVVDLPGPACEAIKSIFARTIELIETN